jgi:SAM-dependent methyltransferase
MAVHPAAAQGYAANADLFVRGRPDYPPDIADWLRDDIALRPGKTALDLGSGTGKFLSRLQETGAAVVAVEPVDAMRTHLIERNPGIEAMAGSAEHIPLADRSVDSVVCAQSFHWFANRRALAEIRRVLRPGGFLGLVWNVRDERVPWVARLTDIIEPHGDDTPRYKLGWRDVFPAEGFTPLVEKEFAHSHTGSPEQVIVARMLSISFVAVLPLDRQDAVAAQIRALIAATPELAGKPRVTFPYRTMTYACHRLA